MHDGGGLGNGPSPFLGLVRSLVVNKLNPNRPGVVAFLAVSLCVCAISPGASAGVAGTRANATLTVTYVGTSSLQVRLADGTSVRSGATIPAGSYQVLVDDADYTN